MGLYGWDYNDKRSDGIGCSVAYDFLPDHLPSGRTRNGGGGRGRGGAGGWATGASCFDLIDERFYGGELFGEFAKVGLEGVELFVEVIQGFGEGLDPGAGEVT